MMSELHHQLIADLSRLVKHPSIGSIPAHAQDVSASAAVVAQMLTDVGCPDVQIIEGPCAPAIIGRFPAPEGAPTICFYAHHDVQPLGEATDWQYPPLELTHVGDRLYARGSADDKAGIVIHLAMLRAFKGKPPVGVTLFIEGEEEVGSPNIAWFLADHGDLIKADAFVILDSVNWAQSEPSWTTTLRGVCDAIIDVETLDHGVHSGQFGGAVPDALTTLCRLLATFHTDEGDVALKGVTESVHFDAVIDPVTNRESAGLLEGVHEIGTGSLADRLWAKPTFTVIGMDTVSVAQSSNTLLPSARARVSMRVPPGMKASDVLEALVTHCEENVPWGARVRVTRGSAGNPAQISTDGPLAKVGIQAYTDAFGIPPVFIGQGGAIPLVNELHEVFPEAEFLVTAIADPDSRIHSTDESVSLSDMVTTVKAQVAFLEALSEKHG